MLFDGLRLTTHACEYGSRLKAGTTDRGARTFAYPTIVMPRACGASSTPRLIDSIAGASGILDHPLSRVMTTEALS